MSRNIRRVFSLAKQEKRPVFIAYLTAGFPHPKDTVPSLLHLQKGGADIIELGKFFSFSSFLDLLGVPFSDPVADGPTIQDSHFTSLKNGIDLSTCLEYVKEARKQGLVVPVILMGYYNPFLSYGQAELVHDAALAGVNGFILVDLPPEESLFFRKNCIEKGLCYVPLITPSTSTDRMKQLVSIADGFIYVVSTLGVTGTRKSISQELPLLIKKIQSMTDWPLAIGFGVSDREQFIAMGELAQGVVIGSKLIQTLKSAVNDPYKILQAFALDITGRTLDHVKTSLDKLQINEQENLQPKSPNLQFNHVTHPLNPYFGHFGGQYSPEALVDCLDEIEAEFSKCLNDKEFWNEFKSFYSYIGRPSSLHLAERLTQECGGAQILLKREDLNHTGSHKINNAIGQALLAKRLGKKRIIAETGAGQHGVATATVCAKLGLECVIYMGAHDVERQALNVFRIRLLGATVIPVESGSKTLKDAINEAMRDWVTNVRTTHYLVGSAIGPHPFPLIVKEFQSIIGKETREQCLQLMQRLPDAVIACVGGGSNAIGLFSGFYNDPTVRLIGVEAAGDGIETGRHSATLSAGTPGVLHGTKTYLLQDANGQIIETHSISAGLDYPGVGPEHAFLKDSNRAEYIAATDREALKGFRALSEQEGIIPALETSHAIYKAMEIASTMSRDKIIVINISGRGDKDVISVAKALPIHGDAIQWPLRFEGSIQHAT